ncbi:MAG: conjugal transfer protein TraG N-terminal domain-containing protein, partial [Rhodocyclaceae bacterium]|nr:conjugal transfer protein TraG N-terminal domain-containing protein [Rhodocyclaceae bacterium]
VTVGIVDKTGGLAGKVVDNVPFGVAVLGQSHEHHRPHAGRGFSETAFQVIPGVGRFLAELSYQQNGLMFGNRLIRETGNVVFQDPAFRTDLINFIHNCTTYDLIDGTLDPATFSASDDVWPLMAPAQSGALRTLTGRRAALSASTPAPMCIQ